MPDLILIDPPVWDAVCTFGRYQHETIDGEPCITVHDASTCKVMLDDFAAHPQNDIFYDKKHEVVDQLGERAVDDAALREWAGDGHAMAWANAMAMVVGGQVARYEPHPGAPQEPPSAQEVLAQSDGTMRPDGVYCRRFAVTPRGADPANGMAAFRHTSPFFVPEKDGHRLLNLTVTNDPRMRDCALAFSRERRAAVAMSRMGAQAMANSQYRARADEMVQRAREAKGSADQTERDLDAKGREWSAGAKAKMATASPDEKRQIQEEARVWQQRMAAAKEASRLAVSAVTQATSAMNLAGVMAQPATPEQKQEFELWEKRVADVLRDMESVKGRALRMENKHMDPKEAAVMTAAGIGPDDSPEEKLTKMTAYARQMSEMRCAEETREQETAPTAAPAKQDDAPSVGKETPGEEAAEHAELKALLERVKMLEAALSANKASLQSMEEERRKMEESRKMESAQKFARSALAMGRVYGNHKGTAAKTEEWLAGLHKQDPKVAESVCAPDDTFPRTVTEAQVMTRYTAGGVGIGAPNPAAGPAPVSERHAINNEYSRAHAQAMSRVRQRSDADKLNAEQKYNAAAALVREENPSLAAAYERGR